MYDAKQLYELLPSLYRIRDAKPEQGEALKALLSVIADQLAVLEEDLAQLYDDQFIETCAEWVVPYIGDLIGYRSLHYVAPKVVSQRAEVAHTIAYRRRKGTATMLEQLARDVTDWDARVVEFFRLLGWTQHMNHIRPECYYAPNLRRQEELARVNTPFDALMHTVDVRSITSGAGRYNIPNVGIFLWRLKANKLTKSPAVEANPGCYHFNPLGRDVKLYTHPEVEEDIEYLAEPINVPQPITRHVLQQEKVERPQDWQGQEVESLYYGRNKSILIEMPQDGFDPKITPYQDIIVCDLSDQTNDQGQPTWGMQPSKGQVAIDPELGRIRFAKAPAQPPLVTYHYGFSADIGGGEYQRSATTDPTGSTVAEVSMGETIGDALAKGNVIEIRDSGRYQERLNINVPQDKQVVLRAVNEHRPALILSGDLLISLADKAGLVIDGLLIAGTDSHKLHVANPGDGSTATLRLQHCTLVPSRIICLQVDHPGLTLEIDHCIIGALRVADSAKVIIRDSILDVGNAQQDSTVYAAPSAENDGGVAGAMLSIENTTVFGTVRTRELTLASNTIFTEDVQATKTQAGCVRFSYLPLTARVPQRYRCQPDLEIAQRIEQAKAEGAAKVREQIRDEVEAFLKPSFNSRTYGAAEYAQLRVNCPAQIRAGADDESEMGAFHDLFQNQRVINLQVRLDEYLRVGLKAGIFFVS